MSTFSVLHTLAYKGGSVSFEFVCCKVSSWMAVGVCVIDTKNKECIIVSFESKLEWSCDAIVNSLILRIIGVSVLLLGCGNTVGIASSMVNLTDMGKFLKSQHLAFASSRRNSSKIIPIMEY